MPGINEIRKAMDTIKKSLPMVQNELAPDEKTMLSNIISMLQQIMGSGMEAPVEEIEDPIVMEELADTSQEPEVEKEKTVDSAIGDEGADTRLEDQTPVTENAMKKIGKSLEKITQLIAGNTVQKKQRTQPESATMKVMKTMAAGMEAIANRMNQQEQFISGFMNQIGVADDIVKKTLETPVINTTPENRPIQNADMVNFMREVLKGFGSNGNNENIRNNQGTWPNNPQNNPWGKRVDVKKELDPVLDKLTGR